MYANLKPFSLVGLPTSEKDVHATATKRDFFDNKQEAAKSVFQLKIRSNHGGEDDGGCTTPKAAEHGGGELPKCPPPPRKPKSAPSAKRKAGRVLLDLSSEIESMFPSNIVRDFVCGKIKKVRTEIL